MAALRKIVSQACIAVVLLCAPAFAAGDLPPWKMHAQLAPDAVPPVYLAEWEKAENAATCAPLVLFGAEKEPGITLRRANFSGGWAVAYDTPAQRSSFGIAGTGLKAGGPKPESFQDAIRWPDGSCAVYGLQGGSGPGWLAYLTVAGQEHSYNVWSERGKEHLESLLGSIRMVNMSSYVKPDFPSIVRELAAWVPELAAEYGRKPAIELRERYLRYAAASDGGRKASKDLRVYWYEHPTAERDWALVSFDNAEEPTAAFFKCFAYDRKARKLTAAEPPFTPLAPEAFDKAAGTKTYRRVAYAIGEDGHILISAAPDMATTNVMVARWDKKDGKFTVYKRGVHSPRMKLAADSPAWDDYVKNVLRPNVQRIAAIKQWAWVEKKNASDPDISLGGADLAYYYSDDGLQKIVAELAGETYASTIEYYFFDQRLSFIHEKREQFDGGTQERRGYFKGDACFRVLGNKGKKLAPDAIDVWLLREQGYYAYSIYLAILRQ